MLVPVVLGKEIVPLVEYILLMIASRAAPYALTDLDRQSVWRKPASRISGRVHENIRPRKQFMRTEYGTDVEFEHAHPVACRSLHEFLRIGHGPPPGLNDPRMVPIRQATEDGTD